MRGSIAVWLTASLDLVVSLRHISHLYLASQALLGLGLRRFFPSNLDVMSYVTGDYKSAWAQGPSRELLRLRRRHAHHTCPCRGSHPPGRGPPSFGRTGRPRPHAEPSSPPPQPGRAGSAAPARSPSRPLPGSWPAEPPPPGPPPPPPAAKRSLRRPLLPAEPRHPCPRRGPPSLRLRPRPRPRSRSRPRPRSPAPLSRSPAAEERSIPSAEKARSERARVPQIDCILLPPPPPILAALKEQVCMQKPTWPHFTRCTFISIPFHSSQNML